MKFQECQHVLSDGNTCRAPRLRNAQFCYFHVATRDRIKRQNRAAARKLPLQVPVLEDPWTVQLALSDIINAMLTDRIDSKKAALALYALQTASANMKNLGSRRPESYDEYVPELQASMPEEITEQMQPDQVRQEETREEEVREGEKADITTPNEVSSAVPPPPAIALASDATQRRKPRLAVPPKKPVQSVKEKPAWQKLEDILVKAHKHELNNIKMYSKAFQEGRCDPLANTILDDMTYEEIHRAKRNQLEIEMEAARARRRRA